MKELIITSGILLFMVTVMGLQTSLNELMHRGQELKFAADEAAATAGLCIDPEAYGEGIIRFDREKAREEALAITRLNGKQGASLSIQYEEGEHPAVTVRLKQGELQVHSKYEYLGIQSFGEGGEK